MPSEAIAKNAVIRYISGSRRGLAQSLDQKTFFVIKAGRDDVNIVAPDHQPEPQVIATLHRHGMTYEVEINPGQEVWVNGERVADNRVLKSGDLLELGHAGPVVRFRLYPQGATPKKTLAEALADSIDSAKAEGHSRIDKAGRFLTGFTHDLATQTTVWFRIWMLILITLVIASIVVLVLQNYRFQKQLSSESLRLEGIAKLLEKTGAEAMTRDDLVKLREEMGTQLTEAVQRVETLEARSDATGNIIKHATSSIAFVQGQYGFIDPETGSLLRYLVTPHGILFFTGEDDAEDGEVVKINFSGTAFVVSDKGLLLTNRHIAEPWLMRSEEDAPNIEGMDPKILGLRAFLPGLQAPFETSLLQSDPQIDLAILMIDFDGINVKSLDLGKNIPGVGEEVLVMGYPLGISGMLARAGPNFLEDIDSESELSAWEVVDRLAEQGYIKPLASRGIVSQLSDQYIVYDAETTIGGSGGPVFSLDGVVVGVNTAVMKDFGGSNLGIPAAHAYRLLESISTQE